ncbi:hypothetical protein Tco_0644323 [Tanacetum coccineum]
MARLWDCNTFMRAVFSPTLKSLAIMTGNLLSPSKNAFFRCGGEEVVDNVLTILDSFQEEECHSHGKSHSAISIPDLYDPDNYDMMWAPAGTQLCSTLLREQGAGIGDVFLLREVELLTISFNSATSGITQGKRWKAFVTHF